MKQSIYRHNNKQGKRNTRITRQSEHLNNTKLPDKASTTDTHNPQINKEKKRESRLPFPRWPTAGRWRLSCSPSARVLRKTSTHTHRSRSLLAPSPTLSFSFSFRSHSLLSFSLSPLALRPLLSVAPSLRQSGADTPPSLVTVTGDFLHPAKSLPFVFSAPNQPRKTPSHHLEFLAGTLVDLEPRHGLRGSPWRETSPRLQPSRGECRHMVLVGCGCRLMVLVVAGEVAL